MAQAKSKPAKNNKSVRPQERLVSISKPVLPGYTFIPKGNVYITRHCRTQTLASNQPLYIVHVRGQPNKTLGLRVPSHIATDVTADASSTEHIRAAAVDARDARNIEEARAMLKQEFPRMPSDTMNQVIAHAFQKKSGRVGRAGALDLDERIRLAVFAHARHVYTEYDTLLKTTDRESARKDVKETLDAVMRTWSQKSECEQDTTLDDKGAEGNLVGARSARRQLPRRAVKRSG